MKIEVKKAEKALGFTHLMRMMNAIFEDRKLHDELEKEFEEYKKPGFFEKRTIRVVQELPKKLEGKDIYIAFHTDGYEIRSNKNFIFTHASIAGYGNLRYMHISDLDYNLNREERELILKKLISGNSGTRETLVIGESL